MAHRRSREVTFRRTRAIVALSAVAIAASALALWLATRSRQPPSPTYVGSTTCASCHAPAYQAWKGSHHDLAMQVAEPGRVLGDFNDVRVDHAGLTTRFFRSGTTFRVTTDGVDGRLQDFDVKYTFGVSPLQQYLIELPGGRVQALSVAWDTRPKDEGGQRWFHLYGDERIDHTDDLHWTGRHQNWNYMCADCHSTNLRKRYEATGDRFQTTWSEINVACEACHGPGSRHADWAGTPGWLRRLRWDDNGLTAQLTERRGVRWNIDQRTFTPARSAPRTTSIEIDVCARCHSRREQIAEGYVPGAALRDYYVPAEIAPGLYYADGQQRDEVYTYGSFLQSRMAHAGVTCSDCHEPHSQRVRAQGNLLCAQCHVPRKYDDPSHHFHRAAGPGAQCVSCHMPTTTYMRVDGRRDHSIRIPRPDRTVSLGVPNACATCHADRGAEWAARQIRAWYGHEPGGFQTFAEAFHAADTAQPGSDAALGRVAVDGSVPAIVRASALARLASAPGRAAYESAVRQLADPDPDVRHAALRVLESFAPEERAGLAAPLLRDPVRAVRLQAAWVVAPAAAALASTDDAGAFSRAAEEFIESRRAIADRPEARTTLGFFFAQLNRRQEAKDEYRSALRLAPRYTPAYVNLSDLHRADGSEQDAARVLREGLAAVPDDATLHHALGLSLARGGRQAEAIEELKKAAELATGAEAARFTYAYAVALHSAGRTGEAIAMLERARTERPRDRDVLFALATFHRDAGRQGKALEFAVLLQQAHPDDPDARALVASLSR